MKKLVPLVACLFLIMPFASASYSNPTPTSSNITPVIFSVVKIEANGFAYPTGTSFYLPLHGGWAVWYCKSGTTTTRYFTNPHEIKGEQLGIAYVMVGIWKAPRIFSQPGNITATMLVLAAIIVQPS